MGLIWTPQQRTRQPTVSRIDTSHPACGKLAGAFNFLHGISPINLGQRGIGLSWTHTGTAPYLVPTADGIGSTNGATSGCRSTYGAARAFNGFAPANSPAFFTWVMRGGTYVSNGSSANYIWSYGVADSGVGWLAYINSSSVLNVRVANTVLTGPSLTSGKIYRCVAGRNAAGACWLWVNGQLIASGTSATAADTSFTATLQVLGDSTTRPYAGALNMLAFGSGDPAPFGARLSENPWQIFAPDEIPVWFTDAGGDLDITATRGDAAAVGYTATVDAQTTIAASLGTAAATGYAATVDRQLSITASCGTAAGVGYSADVAINTDIATTRGDAAAIGYAADVTFGDDLNITASVGTAAAIGYAANLDLQITIAATRGDATALGYAATITDTDPLHGFSQDQLDFLVAYMTTNLGFPSAADVAAAVWAKTLP